MGFFGEVVDLGGWLFAVIDAIEVFLAGVVYLCQGLLVLVVGQLVLPSRESYIVLVGDVSALDGVKG